MGANMSTIEIELDSSKGVGLVVGRHGNVAMDFGENTLNQIIDAIGRGTILDQIGRSYVIEHFDIEEE
jgi:hypothetical protein